MISWKTLFATFAVLLFSVTAWADKPVDYERGPFHFGPFPLWDCTQFDGMDFWLWTEGEEFEYGKMFFDKDGWAKQTVGTTILPEFALWIPADPGCNVWPWDTCVDPVTPMDGKAISLSDLNGTPEQRNAIWREWIIVDPDDTPDSGDEFWWPTWGRESGIFFKIVVPGYGALVTKAGLQKLQLNFDTGEWDVIQITPNNADENTETIHAICSYIDEQ